MSEVVIPGEGITGNSIAFHLAERGTTNVTISYGPQPTPAARSCQRPQS